MNDTEMRRYCDEVDGPKMANLIEGGKTPLLSPSELFRLGYSMIAYPTTLIFRVARTIENALADLKAGRLSLEGEGVGFEEFKDIVGFAEWAAVEDKT